ncbi:hypothetical protein B296_00013450 [Ensete ventricosum]|uniref:Uncharacterized protein n=1 Tax=Ensete ventricosum TaxID=4639 RepID=A0A427A4Q9_ENSVE|nr:hypothetical protein B296_00013450 [Ensete ventricosum]
MAPQAKSTRSGLHLPIEGSPPSCMGMQGVRMAELARDKQLWELLWMMVGWMEIAVKVEEQRDAKNAALISNDRTPKDSNARLISIGARPSLELYRGSSLLVVSHKTK